MDFKRDQHESWTIDGKVFHPFYTPEKMLDLGVFDYSYFELALEEDYEHIRPSIQHRLRMQNGKPKPYLNAFKVHAGQSYGQWIDNGWIFEEDPIGWFHWYMRFISGRRHMRDAHQIGRWLAYARWHKRALNQKNQGRVSSVINQGLLHWSWPVVV